MFVIEVILDALLDTAKLLPFLFLTYLLMEWLEHKAGERAFRAISGAGKVGPLAGAALGLLPQCGFSAAAAGLYAGRVITLGTLFAVFLATSDEMIPVFLGGGVPVKTLFTVLGIKFLIALLVGFAVDLIFRKRQKDMKVVDLCEQEHCHCEKGILRSALHHTLHIILFVLIVNLVLGGAMEWLGTERLSALSQTAPVLTECLAVLVGLIPNCAASVAIATFYANGILPAGAMIGGLLTGAGAGVLVLLHGNHNKKENLLILAALFGIGVFFGCLLDFTGLAGILGL